MQTTETVTRKPLGNFEIAPEFNDTKDPLDVVYEHYHCHYVVALQPWIRIVSSVLRGMTQPQGRVDLAVVEDGGKCIFLSYSPEEARTLARLLMAAADDADAAHAVLCAEQQGGAA